MKKRNLLLISSIFLLGQLCSCSISFEPGTNTSITYQNVSIGIIDINDKNQIFINDEIILQATINGEDTSDVSWKSSDSSIIEIDKISGKLKALSEGSVLIYATYNLDSTKNASIEIEVCEKKNTTNSDIQVTITNKIDEILCDEKYPLDASLSGSYLGIKYESSDTSIATIDKYGYILGIKAGSCTIKALAIEDDSVFDSFTIKILSDDSQFTSVHGYKLSFADYFDGDSLNEQYWTCENGDGSQYGIPGWGNSEKQYYQKDNVSVKDGKLSITAKKEQVGGYPYTSGRIKTAGKIYKKYGRVEAKMKLPVGTGLWPAFWLLPNSSKYGGWPNSGEIDIMEARGRIEKESSGALHFANPSGNHNYVSNTCSFTLPDCGVNENKTINAYHIYALEWDEDEIRWYVDDYNFMTVENWTCKNANYPAPFDTEFYIIFNLAVGGNFDNGFTPNDSDLPAELLVDYVKWYQ